MQMLDLFRSVCSPTKLCASQLATPVSGPILQSEQKPQVSTADNLMHQRLAQLWDILFVKEGVLYLVFVGLDGGSSKIEGRSTGGPPWWYWRGQLG